MTLTEAYKIYLPKWPALLVKGEPVTWVQAAEILIRTASWMPFTNNRAWAKKVEELTGLTRPVRDDGPFNDYMSAMSEYYLKEDAFCKAHGVLPLNYLGNDRIASSWVGGPHGWCNWDGNIWCNNYNIGKWPTVKEVMADWRVIARAFPYLNLTCQLLNCEASSVDLELPTAALVEFRVKDGKVKVYKPTGLLMQPSTEFSPWVGAAGEVGCTEDTLAGALAIARRSVANEAA